MTTVLIVISGIALAAAIQAIIQNWHSTRQLKKMLRQIGEEIGATRLAAISLAEQLNHGDDFVADEPVDVTVQSEKPDQTPPADSKPVEQAADEPVSHIDTILQKANDRFTTQYRELCNGLDEHNITERIPELGQLLVEMGIWLKDFLPVSQGDFNVTSDMLKNVDSVGLDKRELTAMLESAQVPNENPYKTPMEVIAINRLLRQWGINNLDVLLSGYCLSERKQGTVS